MQFSVRLLAAILFICMIHSCTNKELFKKVGSGHTGIHFNNLIVENDSTNVLDYEYVYNGGGVGVADFNNDGLPDLFFSGNMVSCKLYLNQGDLKFKDVTDIAGVTGEHKWCSGVTVVDINNDGLKDIYVSVTKDHDSTRRRNLMYVNQGLKDGVPVFKEMAHEYGLDDASYSTNAAFFDYDDDGDLDMYVLTDKPDTAFYSGTFRAKLLGAQTLNTGRLYRNDYNSVTHHAFFSDVSIAAGITIEGYGLGVNITDINRDGWKDILVTNDFISEDILYINNRDGTFTNKANTYFKHTSLSAMGNDVADINNDGLMDIVSLDMLPPDNLRKKTMIAANNYNSYVLSDMFGYQYQYTRNTLQLNCGPRLTQQDSLGDPVFSEIGFLSGIAQTDWSWCPSLADFDNDSYKDLFITNGFPKDVSNLDFISYRDKAMKIVAKKEVLAQLPAVKISNYCFKNNGNLVFSDVTKDWGMSIPSFSNGAVYADLDNDGDLDYIVNNINDEAFIYENTLQQKDSKSNNYLRIVLKGDEGNIDGLGSFISIFYQGDKKQVSEFSPYRGYLSTVEFATHFGLGGVDKIDSLLIEWPGGKKQTFYNVAVNQTLNVDAHNASPFSSYLQNNIAGNAFFKEVTDSLNVHYKHEENDFVDFNEQKLLPHKLSQYGPALAVADMDGNGLDDIFVGSSYLQNEELFLQQTDGTFKKRPLLDSADRYKKKQEDMGVLLFDVDGDGDNDLYLVSGSYEFPPGYDGFQDRLYINDGKGNFKQDSFALPKNLTSKSCVKAADYDHDGDLDLFIGGRVLPDNYPKPVSSFICRNDSKNGKIIFTDVTSTVAKDLQNIGMVCDALWTDFDNDGYIDLLLVGEWMPLTVFKNNKGIFKNITSTSGLQQNIGWWNSIVAGDFDNDGDIDYIAGNLGLNSFYKADEFHPIRNYSLDFDQNGSYDPITTMYLPSVDGSLKEFPTFGRDDLVKQMILMRRRFHKYEDYALAPIDSILKPEEQKEALKLIANSFQSSYIENLGHGKFKMHSLPLQAQMAPIYGITAEDFDADGNLDLVINGNDFGTEVSTGRYDALNGLLMKGDGKGNFYPRTIQQSGIYIPGDGKALVSLQGNNGKYLLAASQNKGVLKILSLNNSNKIIPVEKDEVKALIIFKNNKTRLQEFYFGNSFLSQSARFILSGGDVKQIEIIDTKNKKRVIKY